MPTIYMMGVKRESANWHSLFQYHFHDLDKMYDIAVCWIFRERYKAKNYLWIAPPSYDKDGHVTWHESIKIYFYKNVISKVEVIGDDCPNELIDLAEKIKNITGIKPYEIHVQKALTKEDISNLKF